MPSSPGVYLFKDADGRVLYVGKASSLARRLSQYFTRSGGGKEDLLVRESSTVDWIVVETETEALLLEQNLIKRHRPRYNVLLRDDKTYPWVAVDMRTKWPRVYLYRGRPVKGVKYLGPFGKAKELRLLLEQLQKAFPHRSCADSKFRDHERMGEPCLLYHIRRCPGPCVGAADEDEYLRNVRAVADVLSGRSKPLKAYLQEQMERASEALEFERAAFFRDRLRVIEEILEARHQGVISEKEEDCDAIGICSDELSAVAIVLHVREGRLLGTSAFDVDLPSHVSQTELAGEVLRQVYLGGPTSRAREVPPVIYAPPSESVLELERLLSSQGQRVRIVTASRGRARRLCVLAEANARQALERRKLRRRADLVARSKALSELQSYLSLRRLPFRIECYDCSHLAGTLYSGSMVVIEDGLPRGDQYRHFRLSLTTNDDYLAMRELLARRLSRLTDAGGEESDGSFGARPDLILIDGGKGQLEAALSVAEAMGLSEELEFAALAKRFEEVYRPGRPEPVLIPRGSEALLVLQLARDEAHRFALRYHRKLREKATGATLLDQVPGIGPKRKAELLKRYRSLGAIARADPDEIARSARIPLRVAESLHALAQSAARRA